MQPDFLSVPYRGFVTACLPDQVAVRPAGISGISVSLGQNLSAELAPQLRRPRHGRRLRECRTRNAPRIFAFPSPRRIYVYISSRVTRRHATGPVFTVLRELVIPTQRWRPSLAYNALPARSLVMQMAVPRPPRLDIRQKQRRKA